MSDSTLPPWERLPHFFTPVETVVALGAGPVLLIKGDPMRVFLAFGIAGIAGSQTVLNYPIPIAYGIVSITSALPNMVVSTNPNLTTQSGFALNPIFPPFVVDARTWGPAVTLPWYGRSGGSGPLVTVLSISMRDWPEDQTLPPSIIQDTDNGKFTNRYVRPAGGNGNVHVYSNRWRQRQAGSPYDLPDFDH